MKFIPLGQGLDAFGTAGAAAAYLQGTYAENLQHRHAPIPTWAWLNALAHCDSRRLFHLAEGRGEGLPAGRRHRRWRDVVESLAEELVDRCAEQGCSLGAVQSELLQPLEEDMIGHRIRFVPTTPAQLMGVTLLALDSWSAKEGHPLGRPDRPCP